MGMEPADTDDLVLASEQGTMLEIKVNGIIYGSGGYQSESSSSYDDSTIIIFTLALLSVCLSTLAFVKRKYLLNVFSRELSALSYRENLNSFSLTEKGSELDNTKTNSLQPKGQEMDDQVIYQPPQKLNVSTAVYV